MMAADHERSHSEAGVSAVIGAVLVFGLMSSAFVIWSFTTLPVWIADNEEARNQEVVDGFSGLKSGMDLLIADGSSGPISRSFPLSADEVPLLQPAPSIGRLYFQSGFGWHGNFNNSTSHMLDGVVDGDPTEAIDGNVLTGIGRLDALTLSLTANGIQGNNEASITMEADDGTSTVTGTLALIGRNVAGNSCGDTALVFTVTSDLQASDRIRTQCGFGGSLTDFPFNPLEPDLGFASQLRRLDTGYSITLTDDNAQGTFGAAWQDTNGLTQVLGAGVVVGDVTRDEVGGRIVFDPIDLAHLDQSIIWEGGSIIRQQGDGGVVSVPFDFDLRVDGSTGYLRWTILDLEGTGDVTGRGSASVALTSNGYDSQMLTCTDGSITLDTAFPETWAKHFRSQILIAGASASTAVTTAPDHVTLSLLDAGGVTEWRVQYRVLTADVVIS